MRIVSGGTVPRIFKVDTRRRWVISFALWLLYPGERALNAHLWQLAFHNLNIHHVQSNSRSVWYVRNKQTNKQTNKQVVLWHSQDAEVCRKAYKFRMQIAESRQILLLPVKDIS
jgi:hypothetical protein